MAGATAQFDLKDVRAGKADPEYVDLLRRVLAIQSDCEIGGPHLYVGTMLPEAPVKMD